MKDEIVVVGLVVLGLTILVGLINSIEKPFKKLQDRIDTAKEDYIKSSNELATSNALLSQKLETLIEILDEIKAKQILQDDVISDHEKRILILENKKESR